MMNAISSASPYSPYSTKPASNSGPQAATPSDPAVKLGPGQGDTSATKPNESESRAPGATEAQKAAAEVRNQLSTNEELIVARLQARDRDVRAHEAAHAASGGGHAGSPSYSYTNGPDGRQYATGGSVPIDVSPASNPEDTIAKMSQVRRAALAPRDPSSADRSIAARASQQLSEAQRELIAQKLADAYPSQASQPDDSKATEGEKDVNQIGDEPVSTDTPFQAAKHDAKLVAEHAANPIRTGISLQA
jgi:hypothetical protein